MKGAIVSDEPNGNEFDDVDEYEDQIEQMILENGMLTHSILRLLVRKGIVTRDEIDEEMERLYVEAEDAGGSE